MTRTVTKKDLSILKRAKSFVHAGRGLVLFFKSTPNAWIHASILIIVITAGLYFSISKVEWMILILTSGMVLAAEAFNTAIEVDIDLTSPSYHPYARDTKDIAAGAVLITSVAALIIGLIIFAPYVMVAVY